MAEWDPIDLIRTQIGKVDELAGLNPDQEGFVHWHNETKTILEKAFSAKSFHFQSFLALRFREVTVKAFASPEIDRINAARYKRDLEQAKNVLQGALKELTLDRTLFKKIQTTPKTVEVSIKGEVFVSSVLQEASLFRAIEQALEGTGLTAIGAMEGGDSGAPFQKRVDQIRRARVGIYDVSGPERVDALLELGAALALGKEAIVVFRKSFSPPAVTRPLEPIEYENADDLVEKLRRRVKGNHGRK